MALALCLAACAGSDAPTSVSPSPATPGVAFPERVVLISVAGMMPAAYRGDGGRSPVMPTVAALGRSGAAADFVTPVTPSARYPAHATLVTGQRPATHGIVADRLIGEHGVRRASYWHASQLQSPTLWGIAGRDELPVASLAWPTTVGAAIPLLIPDLAPVSRGETWIDVIAGASTPALFSLIPEADRADPELAEEGAARDALLTGLACQLLGSQQPPTLTLLLLAQAASAQAGYGPASEAEAAALAKADGQIRRIVDCLSASGRARDTALVIVGDRGVLPVHTLVAPNEILVNSGLVTPSARSRGSIASWQALSRSNGGSAFIYAKSDDAALQARRVLVAAAARTRAFRVVSAEEMLEHGADSEAWFGLEAEPGFSFGNQIVPPLLQAGARRGVGGYLSEQPGSEAGFVAWGRGIRAGVRIPRMRQTDVAPTIARLLGLDLGPVDGRPLIGILSLPATKRAPAASNAEDGH
jgi:hypothetical protein